MLASLPKWVVPAAIFGAFVVIALVYLWLNRGDDDEDEDEDEGEEGLGSTQRMSDAHAATTMELGESDDSRARKSRMIALKSSLEKSLTTRAGVKASSLDRLAMPWFMLVGTEGSGKKVLLASTGLPLPYGPPVEVDSTRKDAGRWWLFDEAVVVEAPTARPVPKPAAPGDSTAVEPAIHLDVSEGWNNLLHLLRRERPDSPLNGIIVTVSCADLVGTRRKNPEEIAEQAEVIHAFLEKTRRVLGVRLPMHLLITKCEVLPGFRSFAETMPGGRRDDIFGWSNPEPLEKLTDTNTVDAGFLQLRKSLESLHDELLAAPETVQDADGLFVFVSEFGEIQDPLREFVAKLLPKGERRPSLFFRGVYFTGDASEMAAKAGPRADDDTAPMHISMEATEAEQHSLVFLRSLFADKIFKEAGLARSAARFRISRDKRVVLAQAAAIAIALLGGAGLWTSLHGWTLGEQMQRPGLAAEATDLTRILSGAAIDLDELRRAELTPGADSLADRRATDAAVINLVGEMKSVASTRVRSAFIPSSWFSKLPGEIRTSTIAGVQDVILPILRKRLQERLNLFLGTPGRTGVSNNVLDPGDPSSLVVYLNDVRELNRNIARFNALATHDSGSVADLSGLLDYLFGERPADPSATSVEFQNALRSATAAPLTVTAAQGAAVVSRAVGLIRSVANGASAALSPTPSAAGQELRALRRLSALSELVDAKTGLVATVSDSLIAGTRLARVVQDSISRYLGVTAVRVLKDPLLPEQATQRLRSMLTSLFEYSLLAPNDGGEIESDLRAGQKLRWDIGQLELATSMREQQRRALAITSEAFAAPTQARIRAAVEAQLRARVIDVVASAQRFTADSTNAANDLASESDNLEGASARVVALAALLDTLKAPSEGRKLIALATRQAEHVLAMGWAAIDSARFFAPHPDAVAAWRGGISVGSAAMGVPDQMTLETSLRDQGAALITLNQQVAPALQFVALPAVKSEVHAKKLIGDWEGISASLEKYAAKDAKNSRFALEEFIRTTMGAIDVAGCQAAAARPDTLKPGPPDFFIVRRRMFRETMLGRCLPNASANAVATYDRLRALFTSRLAGHFPFVDSAKAAAAPDADPAAVREFYGIYDAFAKTGDPALRSDPRFRPGGSTAFLFLDQVGQARTIFAPFIDSASARRAPEYAFVIGTLKGATPGTAQLQTGTRKITLDDSVHSGVWGFGEAVKIGSTDDRAAKPRFASTGWWGLIELAALQHDARVRIYHPDTMVELRLPIFPKVAPALPMGRER